MANCVNCGRELASYSIGEHSNMCPDCRQAGVVPTAHYTTTSYTPQRVSVRRRYPPVTTALLGLNIAAYIAMVVSGVPPLDPTSAQLLKWGANWGPLSLGAQPWRMLASNYLHGGLIHLGLNMWCLWNLGFLAERIFDPWTYLLAYTFSGLTGSIASLWWHPMSVGVGASGAIFGLAGALIAALYLGHLPIPKEAMRATLKSLVAFAGYNLFFGAVSKVVDNSAHIGGLLGGLAVGAFLSQHLMAPPEVRHRWRSLAAIAAAILIVVATAEVRRINAYVVPLEEGMRAFQKGQYDDAVRALEDAQSKKPNDVATTFLLASSYIQKQNFGKAEGLLKHVVEVEPQSADAQFNLGLAQLKLGKYDDAISTLNKAVHLSPQDPDAEQALAEAYEAKNMPDEAKAAFEKADALRKSSK